MQKPTVGRAVHYFSESHVDAKGKMKPQAATIADVSDDGEVTLYVLNPSGPHFVSAGHSEKHEADSWSWPVIDKSGPAPVEKADLDKAAKDAEKKAAKEAADADKPEKSEKKSK